MSGRTPEALVFVAGDRSRLEGLTPAKLVWLVLTLFAELDTWTGQIAAVCMQRHPHQEFVAFLERVASAYTDRGLHLVMDNYATHKRVEDRDCSRRTGGSTPTSFQPSDCGSTWSKSSSDSPN